jgi:perosamine synthetase
MSQQPFLQQQAGYRPVPTPVADRMWEDGLYLPSSVTLDESDIELVTGAIADAATAAR